MIDLHLHSNISDGSESPGQVVHLAKDSGCAAIALTDHDCLDGIELAREKAGQLGIELISGCELSCQGADGHLHLLVYFLEPGEGPLQDELAQLQQVRVERNLRLVERLSEIGMPITYDEILQEAGGKGVGRPHVAAIMVRKGYVETAGEAFDKFLAEGRPAYVERSRDLNPKQAIELATESGALVSLAHPTSLRLEGDAFESAIGELAEIGLVGLESIYGSYRPDKRSMLQDIAERHGLIATGGSDFHGSYKPELKVGVGFGDLCVPDDVLDKLKDRR